jgi:RNA recognition motif-containing protein
MNIFVGGIPWGLSEEAFKELFEKFGTVSSARIIVDKRSGRSKGYGFIEMPDEEEAKKAIEGLNETEIEGRKIGVTASIEKTQEEKDRDRERRDNFKSRNNRENRY